MQMSTMYSSLAIFQFVPQGEIAIAALSVTTEDCVVSGAWILSIKKIDQIKLILSNRLVLTLGRSQKDIELISKLNLSEISFSEFFREARLDVVEAIEIYENYKSMDPKKRKNLVKPSFFDWPKNIDFSKSSSLLEDYGIPGSIQGTDPKFENVLSAARLTKFYIDKWRSDENERSSRRYVEGEKAASTILPKVWLH